MCVLGKIVILLWIVCAAVKLLFLKFKFESKIFVLIILFNDLVIIFVL